MRIVARWATIVTSGGGFVGPFDAATIASVVIYEPVRFVVAFMVKDRLNSHRRSPGSVRWSRSLRSPDAGPGAIPGRLLVIAQ